MKSYKKRINPNTLMLLKRITVGVISISVVLLLLWGIWHGTRLASLTITSIETEGGETIDNSKLESLASSMLEGEYLGFIPKSFSWFYPKQKIYDILDSVDRIHNIQIERNGWTKLHITYEEYVPHSLWCVSIASNDCVFLDKRGYAFADAPELSGGSFLRFIRSGGEPVLGESLLKTDSYLTLHDLSRLLSEQGWFVSHIEIDQVGDIFLQIVGGGELKVSASLTPEEIIENLLIILSSDEFSDIKPGNFKYIDLRFGNKVFVNEELDQPDLEVEFPDNTVIEE